MVLKLNETLSGLQDQYNYSEEDALMYQYYQKIAISIGVSIGQICIR